MNLGQLEVLVAIVETGSLTEAGEVVGLTQSAVSHSLSKLEAELGVTLLERGRQGVTLTRIGADVLHHARAILTQVDVIRQKTARERGLAIGKLRLGCVSSIPPRLLTGILRDFQQQYPDIDIVLFEGTPQELVDWLADGVLDLGTVITPDAYLRAVPLAQSNLKVIVAADHPLAAQTTLRMDQLASESLIGPKAEYGIYTSLPSVLDVSLPRPRYEVSSTTTIYAMVREGMGYSLVPDMLLDAAPEGITGLSLTPPRRLNIYLAANTDSPAAAAFLQHAHEWAKGHGYLPDST